MDTGMKTDFLLIHLLVLQFICSYTLTDGVEMDPCKRYTHLQRIDQRLPTKTAAFGATICDRYINEDWYRAESAKMTESVPKLLSCSTTFPVYLSGPHPTQADGITLINACKRGLWGTCTSKFPIRVKNCGEFYVYYLRSTETCSSAYCFEYVEQDEAPDQVPTNVVATYSDIKWKDKGDFSFPYLVYSCTFDKVPNTNYCYNVFWLIGNKVVYEQGVKENITKGESKAEDFHFHEDDYHLGITLSCSVGASYCGKSRVGKRVTSKGFYIGLQLQTKEPIQLEEAGRKKITFKSTVPFACTEYAGSLDTCVAHIQMSRNTQKGCKDVIEGSKVDCNEEIKGFNIKRYDSFYKNKKWQNEEYSITLVHVKSDLVHKQTLATEQYFVMLEVQGRDNDLQLWKGARDIARIRIQVKMKASLNVWKDSVCSATGDPHITNFDKYYFHDYGGGTRYLYENRDFSQQVQIQNYACNKGVQCICGIAVSAGRDVFLISVCNNVKVIDYVNCEDHLLFVQKIDERNYEVRLPQGTKVVVRMSSILNVYIYPSIKDVEKTEGLCGYLDKRKDGQDFTFHGTTFRRNNHDTQNSGIRVPPTKDLFRMIDRDDFSLLQAPKTKVDLCTCKTKNGRTNELTCTPSMVQCDMKMLMRKVNMPCFVRNSKKRRRRHILQVDKLREKRQSQTDQTGLALTEKEAMAKCSELLLSSKMYNVCTEVVKELGNSFAEDCKLDLMYTGDYTFAKMALEGALGSCKYSVVRNTALQEDLPELTTEIFTQICPNNCSGNGICENGSCSCEQSFGGADCSYSLVMPPKVLSIHGDGICDRSQENCKSVVFYGDNFLQYGNTTCNVSVFQFIADGSLLATMNNAITSGEQYSIFQASCDIDDSDQIFATLAKVSISNDGYIFTQEYEVINFDSTCQIYDSTSKQVMLQSGFCYIDGGCYHNMEKNPSKPCQVCQSAKSVDSWSYDTTFCFISDNCYSDLDPNPSDNCEVCSISKSTSTWSISDTTCVINGSCHLNGDPNAENRCEVCSIKSKGRYEWSQSNSTCVIGGQCFIDGEAAPRAQCRVCDFKRNASEWTLQSSFCFIDGKCVRNGRSNLEDPCFTCNVDKSQYEWSTKNQYCYNEGGCYLPGDVDPAEPCNMCIDVNGMIKWALNPDFCKINDYCYRNGTINPKQSCYECNSSVNQTSWSQSELFCIIDGGCFSDGANNTEKECLFCDVTQRKTEWSLRSEDICYIDGECFSDGHGHQSNFCQKCNASHDPISWHKEDGTCLIDGKCYKDGDENATPSCGECMSSRNQQEWTLVDNFCFINNTCYSNKEENPMNECLECNLQKAGQFKWSTKVNLCHYEEQCYEVGEVHPLYQCKICSSFSNYSDWIVKQDYCFIDYSCHKNKYDNSSNKCFECNLQKAGRFEWSTKDNLCYLDNDCFTIGDDHPSYECKACASYAFNNASVWTVKWEYCFINNLCLRNGSNHASLSCLECDASINSTEWTVVIGFCFINGKCYANGDFHPLDKDLICDSRPGFKMTWSSKQDKHNEGVHDIDDDSVDTGMILSIVVPVIIVIIIIVVVIFIYRRKSKSGSLSTGERNKELGSLRNPTYETGDVTNIDSKLLQPDNSDPDPQD